MSDWTPLLTGAARDEAVRRVREIAAALVRDPDAWPLSRAADPRGLRHASLASGRAGLALFHARAFAAGLDPAGEALAVTRLHEAFDLVAARPMDASLHCGFTGVAWVAHLLASAPGGDDPVAEVDEALLGVLDDEAFAPPVDLIDGLVGIGVYGLARRGRPAARRLVERVVERLGERAAPEPPGLSWPSGTPSRRAVETGATEGASPWWNLGLAHGVPGVLALLARTLRAGIRAEDSRALLDGGLAWLVAQRLESSAGGAFADFVAADVERTPARVAWCYGDPGVAAALWAAGRALDRADVRAIALDTAHRAATRPLDGTQVVDTGLCHGSAGLGHVFHRLARASGDAVCAAAARRWFGETLAPRPERGGIAGFATWSFERVAAGEYVEDPCLLTGAAGVGLALLAAATPADPLWDAAFLLDLD